MFKKIKEFWNANYRGISREELILIVKVSIFNFIIAGLALTPFLLIAIFIN